MKLSRFIDGLFLVAIGCICGAFFDFVIVVANVFGDGKFGMLIGASFASVGVFLLAAWVVINQVCLLGERKMFAHCEKKTKDSVITILRAREGGIFKRIDENRELLELLEDKAPEVLNQYCWIVSWLQSQDRFLSELATVEGVAPSVRRRTSDFPRPWPERVVERLSRPSNEA